MVDWLALALGVVDAAADTLLLAVGVILAVDSCVAAALADDVGLLLTELVMVTDAIALTA